MDDILIPKICHKKLHQYQSETWPSGWAKGCIECRRIRDNNHKKEGRKKYTPYNKLVDKLKKIKKAYGINAEQYEALKAQNNYCCAICNRHESSFKNGLHVDHCHKTKKIRGVLCGNCNTSLGKMQDSKELLLKAISYLESR